MILNGKDRTKKPNLKGLLYVLSSLVFHSIFKYLLIANSSVTLHYSQTSSAIGRPQLPPGAQRTFYDYPGEIVAPRHVGLP